MTLLLPPGMESVTLVILLAVSFAASLITVAFGIGGGGILLAALASLVPPAALIPVHGLIQVGSNAGRMALLIRHVHWAAIPAFLAGSVVGAGVGGLLVVDLPPAYVQIGVGLFILWTLVGRAPAIMRRWGGLTGAVSSFLTMFFGATGLFVAAFTKSFLLPRTDHVATHATLMTVQHLLKTVVFGILGFAFAPWAGFIAAMIFVGLLGTLAGRIVLGRISDVRFHRALTAILVVLALRLVWAGLRALTGSA